MSIAERQLRDELPAAVHPAGIAAPIPSDDTLETGAERLAAELEATRQLQSISTQLIRERDTEALYQKIIDAAVAIMRSDFASMQMLYPERGKGGELRLLAFRGFDPEAAKFWEWVRADSGCTCGEALRTGRRAIASNVETCDFMAGTADRTAYLQAGMLAAQSTPLISRSGRVLGMISTHWRKPHKPTESDLQRFDVLARQAADLIERTMAEDALRESQMRLAQQVADMQRLHDFSQKLLEQDDLDAVMRDVLGAVAALLNVEKASIQLCDPSGRGLRLIGAIGFDPAFAEKFQFVEACGPTTCAAALNRRERVIVEDLAANPAFAEFAQIAASYAVRAAQSTPLLDRSGAVSAMLTTYFDRPYRPSERELRIMDLHLQLAARHIERKQAERDLRRSEERFRAFVTASSDAVYRVSADWSEMRHLDGKDFIADTHEPSSDWLDKYVPPDDQPRVLAAIEEAIRTKSNFELEHRVRRADGSLGWTLSRSMPILNDQGEIAEWFGAASDVTARKQHEEHRELLLNELNHRVKNTLATVQSMAFQTLRNSPDTNHAREQFSARLIALSKAHDILTRQSWEGAPLTQVVEEAIAAYRAVAQDRFKVEGPRVWLSAKQALAFSMALHELCTNAVKYGALSSDQGRVGIVWTVTGVNGTRKLQIRWTELGGPPVKKPAKRGFGSRLIEHGLAHDIGGEVQLDFAREGLTCTVAAPIEDTWAAE